MTLHRFQRMRPSRQYQEICQKGNYITCIQPPDYFFNLLLYDMNGFYAELWQHRQTGQVFRVRAFCDGPELNAHLRCIHLPDWLQVSYGSSPSE
jgi:hypothetical protein